jgi:1,4-dihydroxy-2-naphthoate octaprenyltransferase
MRWQIQRTTYLTREVFNWRIFSFAIITTLGLQILSNFANDYGDGIKGTDNEERAKRFKRNFQRNERSDYNYLCLPCYLPYYWFILPLRTRTILFAILSNLRNTGNFSCNPIQHRYRGQTRSYLFGIVSTMGVNFLYSKQIDIELFIANYLSCFEFK